MTKSFISTYFRFLVCIFIAFCYMSNTQIFRSFFVNMFFFETKVFGPFFVRKFLVSGSSYKVQTNRCFNCRINGVLIVIGAEPFHLILRVGFISFFLLIQRRWGEICMFTIRNWSCLLRFSTTQRNLHNLEGVKWSQFESL